jgi:hypothetical protein
MLARLACVIVALALPFASAVPAAATPHPVGTFLPPPSVAPRLDAFGIATEGLHRLGAYLEAVAWITAADKAREAAARTEHATAATSSAAPSTSRTAGACAAIPGWIVNRESRCTYTARNASGAGGAYQLMPSTADAMARRIGHPELIGVNAADWPAALQDAAATALWDGGAGACNWTPPNYCG